jgi:hypothetical protein
MREISPQSTNSRVFIVPEDEDPVSKARLVEAEEVPGFRDYWQVLKKHKLKVAACFFADAGLHGQDQISDRSPRSPSSQH